MTRLMFVVPAAGRVALTRICLRQLRRTCDTLAEHGTQASAVVVADDENLDTAAALGFGCFGRRNTFTARKFNDGLQLACDPALNPAPVDYAVPLGSDDWVDWRLFRELPPPDRVMAFRKASFVREDGAEIIGRTVDYTAGVGMRVYPAAMLEACDYRPADEELERGCDTSILVNVSAGLGRQPPILYSGDHHYQFVDWKTQGEQLNSYASIKARFAAGLEPADPFEALEPFYPPAALAEMRGYYDQVRRRPRVADLEGSGGPLYRVLRPTGYRGFPQGSEFSLRLHRPAEQRAINRGDIEVLMTETPSIQPGNYRLPRGWPTKEVAAA